MCPIKCSCRCSHYVELTLCELLNFCSQHYPPAVNFMCCMLCEKYFPLVFPFHLMLPCSCLLRKGQWEAFELPSLDHSLQQAEVVQLRIIKSGNSYYNTLFSIASDFVRHECFRLKCQCYIPALS